MGFADGMMGGLGALLGQAQGMTPQWQQQMMNTGSTAQTWNNTYVVTATPVEPVAPRPKGPESAVEWLDRRVAEVCLAL